MMHNSFGMGGLRKSAERAGSSQLLCCQNGGKWPQKPETQSSPQTYQGSLAFWGTLRPKNFISINKLYPGGSEHESISFWVKYESDKCNALWWYAVTFVLFIFTYNIIHDVPGVYRVHQRRATTALPTPVPQGASNVYLRLHGQEEGSGKEQCMHQGSYTHLGLPTGRHRVLQ